jgi:uncharacterized membrane protein YraQ (UPF0718 family)
LGGITTSQQHPNHRRSGQSTEHLHHYFFGIFIEAFPFLLIGTFASGLVEVFVNKDDLARLIPRQPVLAALMGTLLGFAFRSASVEWCR